MSTQDDKQPNRNSAPEALEQVLSSLQNMLEKKHFPFQDTPDSAELLSEPVPEPFSEQPGELYDDPLNTDDIEPPLLHAEAAPADDMDIPILDDIVFKGLDEDAGRASMVEFQLTQLRKELEMIVDDIVDEARQQIESGEQPAGENSLQRFLRELSQQNPD